MTNITSAHTPGPWTVSEPTGAYIQSPAGGIAALTYGAREADARLIAAAPDLLTALDCAEGFIAGFEGDETQEGIDWLLATIRAAITRATGA